MFMLTFVGGAAICMDRFMQLPGVGSAGDGFGVFGIAVAHALAITIAFYAFASRSGAHINPAVTIGLWLIGKVKANQMFTYVFMQLLGGVLGGLAVMAMFLMYREAPVALGTPSYDAEELSMVKAIGIEAALTFVLMMTVLMTCVDPARAFKQMGGICLGMAVGSGILIGGVYTGAAMNPARYFGTAAVSGNVSQLGVYFIGPIAGAILAALVYKFFLEEKAPAGVAESS